MFLSVVIPARNDAEMLQRCLASLAAQSRLPDEVVVVDNGSTDSTHAVADAAGARVVWEPVAGIPRASAAGFDAARGDLILRVDADTVCPPTWLADAERAFVEDADLDLLSGGAWFYDASAFTNRVASTVWVGGLYWAMTLYLAHPPIFGSNFAMRRAVWADVRDEFHRERTDIHDDLDLSLHVKPWMTVRYDRAWTVGISARPFSSWSGFTRRLSWILPTLGAHWPDGSPWARRAARRRFVEEQDGERAAA